MQVLNNLFSPSLRASLTTALKKPQAFKVLAATATLVALGAMAYSIATATPEPPQPGLIEKLVDYGKSTLHSLNPLEEPPEPSAVPQDLVTQVACQVGICPAPGQKLTIFAKTATLLSLAIASRLTYLSFRPAN